MLKKINSQIMQDFFATPFKFALLYNILFNLAIIYYDNGLNLSLDSLLYFVKTWILGLLFSYLLFLGLSLQPKLFKVVTFSLFVISAGQLYYIWVGRPSNFTSLYHHMLSFNRAKLAALLPVSLIIWLLFSVSSWFFMNHHFKLGECSSFFKKMLSITGLGLFCFQMLHPQWLTANIFPFLLFN